MMPLQAPLDEENGVSTRTGGLPIANHRSEDSSIHDESRELEYGENPDNPTLQTPAATRRVPFLLLHQTLHPVTLKFDDVVYRIIHPERTILNRVSGVVRPGELLAILGPSGSGKTTLLTALSGRLLPKKISGTITYNDQPFSGHIKRKTGYVSQDDILYPHLTVLETLVFAALLRLTNSLTKEEKLRQVELVILELGLTRCKNSIIGGSLVRGVSGGERRRVSIGQEMLVNPSLLLLDEPTSGLDSTTAQRIVSTLQGLARAGRTVVTTIHQPSSRLYHMFDRVVLLSEGNPIYSGKAAAAMDYFASLGFAPVLAMNPADFLLDLANGVKPDTKLQTISLDKPDHQNQLQHEDQSSLRQILISSYNKSLADTVKLEVHHSSIDQSTSTLHAKPSCRSLEKQWSTSWWEQFKVLLRRGLKERKHESFSWLKIFQVISLSILSGLLWWHSDNSHIQDKVGLLFFFSIFWSFFPLYNAIFTYPQERAMLIKERSSGMYRLSSYFFARMAGDLPMELILPTIFVSIAYWMGGLKPTPSNFLLSLLVILLNVLVAQGLGLALGAILMEVKQAAMLASVLMLTFLLAGGYYIQHIPPFIAWLKQTSFSYYCYKLLLGVQYNEQDYYDCGIDDRCKVADFPTIKHMGLGNKGSSVAGLAIMLVGYRLIAYIALRMRLAH